MASPPEGLSYSNPMYEPFWAAAADLSMPISLHILTGHADESKAEGIFKENYVRVIGIIHEIQRSFSQIMFSGVLERHPGLTIVSAENDIGWGASLPLPGRQVVGEAAVHKPHGVEDDAEGVRAEAVLRELSDGPRRTAASGLLWRGQLRLGQRLPPRGVNVPQLEERLWTKTSPVCQRSTSGRLRGIT